MTAPDLRRLKVLLIDDEPFIRSTNRITRYTTSAFLRAKLGAAINERGLAPHIFETRAEAEAEAVSDTKG